MRKGTKHAARSRLNRSPNFSKLLICKLLHSIPCLSVNMHSFAILVERSRLSSKRGRNVWTTFPGAIQVLQRDSARGDACLLVLNRVTSRERNLDGRVVRGVTERRVTEQRLQSTMNNDRNARGRGLRTSMKASLVGGQAQGMRFFWPSG